MKGTEEDTETCAHKDCVPPQPVTVRFDHPLYDKRYGTCAAHEPPKHDGMDGCGGHILAGECHCP